MTTSVYIYECQECILTFTVEEAFEDHALVCCPVCQSDDIRDVGSGVVIVETRGN